jgi:PAS domain S-box-containing protein
MPQSATRQSRDDFAAACPPIQIDLHQRLLAIGHQLNSSLEPDQALNAMVQGARELLQASNVVIYHRPKDSQTLEPVAAAFSSPGNRPQPTMLPLEEGLPGRAIREAGPVALPPSDADPARLAIPLEIHGELHGALYACRPTPFGQADLMAAETLAIYVAAALHAARTHAHLRERERALGQLSDALQEGVWRVDAQGNTVYVNPRLAAMLGYQPHELRGRPVTDLMDAQSAIENSDTKRRRRAGQSDRYRCTLLHRDGTPVLVEIASGPLYNSKGAYDGALAAVTDLTERLAWIDRLRTSDARFRSLYDEMPGGSLIYRAVDDGADFVIVDVNRAAQEMDGYRAEDIVGGRVSDLMPADVQEQLLEPLRRVWRTGQPERVAPFYWESEQGRSWRQNQILRLPSGEVVTVFNDVTASIKAQRAADRHARLLDAIVHVQQEALTCENEAQVAEAALHAAEELTGSAYGWMAGVGLDGTVTTLGVSPSGWAACLIPLAEAERDLRGQILRGVRRLVLEQGQTIVVDDAATDPRVGAMPAGHPAAYNLLAAPIRYKGAVQGLIAVGNKPGGYDQDDVQALEALAAACGQALLHLRDEIALRRSEETLRVLLDAPDDLTALLDTQGHLLAMNQAARALLRRHQGFSGDEAIGQCVWDLLPSPAAELHQQVVDQVLALVQPLTWEDELYGIPYENAVYPICDPDGRVVRIAYIGRDITDWRRQQQAREERRRALERLHQLALEMNQPQPVDELNQRIVCGATTMVQADRIALAHLDPATGHLHLVASIGFGLPDGTPIPAGEGLCGWAVREDRAVQVDDYAAWEGALRIYAERGLHRALGIPLKVGDEVIGALAIGCSDRTGPFADEEVQLLSLYAAQAALALQNARLLSEARATARANLRLAQEINHRVKNNLSAVLALVEGERTAARDDPHAVASLQRLLGRIRGLVTVHNLLAASDWEVVSLPRLLPQVVGSVARAVPRDKNLSVSYDCDEITVSADQARAVALIANELATNVVKHAMAERCQARLTVRVRAARGRVRLWMWDDGPGCPPEALNGEGLELVRDLVHSELRGRLRTRSADGLCVTILFPLAQPRPREDAHAQG